MQTRRMALVEIGLNTGVGFLGSVIITYTILHQSWSPAYATAAVTIACTIWSILRQYIIRRYFNKLTIKEVSKILPK